MRLLVIVVFDTRIELVQAKLGAKLGSERYPSSSFSTSIVSGAFLRATRDALRFIGGAVDTKIELGSHAPIQRPGEKAADAALG